MRNYNQKTEDFNDRLIARRQGNLEGAPGWQGGMQADIPNPPANAERVLEDYLCFADRLEPRGGNKVWSNTTLPSLLGRTGYSLTKSGTTVTKSAGTDFTAADVGNYVVYDDGVHERISAYIGATSVTVEGSVTHTASTAAWIHGPVNMVAKHRKNSRIVILIDTRFFISSDITLSSWKQVFQAGDTAPTATFSTYDEMGDYLIVYNANGIFKLDCLSAGTGAAPCIYFKINEDPTVMDAQDANTGLTYLYRYLLSSTRITGTSITRDRLTNAIELHTCPYSTYNGTRDYFTRGSAAAISAANGISLTNVQSLAANPKSQFTHWSIYRTLDIGVNGIDAQTGKGNNKELFVWVKDVVARRVFKGTLSGTALTSATSVFTSADIGLPIYVNSVSKPYTITAYTSATQVTVTNGDSDSFTNVGMTVTYNYVINAAQAVSGNETVGNATVTKDTSDAFIFTSAVLGTEIVWPTGKRSLIVRIVSDLVCEVAQSEAITSSPATFYFTGYQVPLIDYTTDDELRRRSAGFSIKNRFTSALPNCNIGAIAGGMLWGANRDSGNIYYSQIPNNEQYYAGYYRPSGDGAQIDELPDAIQAMSVFGDRLVFYCSQSRWFIATNDFYTVTLPEVGEVVAVATGHWPISDIGCKDYGSIARVAGVKVSVQQKNVGDIMFCSDGSVRICDGGQDSPDLSINRVKKLLQAYTNVSAALYDTINGYILWKTDGTITDMTHSYRFGVEGDVQGIGWSKNLNGDFPMPFAKIGGIIVLDSSGYFHSLILDRKTGLFYDMATRTGPSGSGLTKLWKDKVTYAGTGGTDIAPAVEFIPDKGTEDHYFLEHKESHFATRPYSEASGYPSGLSFTMKVYKDSDTAYTAQTKSVSADTDIVFDKKVEAHQLRIRLEANKADHLLVSRINYLLSKDKAATPTNRTSAEKGYGKTLANTAIWISPFLGKVINRVTGSTVIAAPTLTTGPDGYADSGIQIAAALTCPSVNVSSKPLIIWANGTIAVTVGGSAVSLTAHGVVGTFTLYYGTATGNGAVVITPTGTVVISDARILNEALSTDARTWYFDDLDDNDGKAVMPR